MNSRFLVTILSIIFVIDTSYSQKSHSEIFQFENDKSPLTTYPISEAFQEYNLQSNYSKDLKTGSSGPDSTYMIYYTSNLDSTYTDKTIYTYDQWGNNTQIQEFWWDGATTNKKPHYKEELTYNKRNLLTVQVISEVESDLNFGDSLLPNIKFLFAYDENNRKTLKGYFDWDMENSCWKPDTNYKEEYIYNSAGNLAQKKGFMFHPFQRVWMPTTSVDYSFDKTSNTLIELEKYYYEWKGWEQVDSSLYHLNNDSLCSLLEVYWFNSIDKLWEKRYQTEYTYNEIGMMISELYGMYYKGKYDPQYRFEYTYNDNNLLNFMIEWIWPDNKQAWAKIYAYKYFYSDHNATEISNIKTSINLYPNPGMDIIQFSEVPEGSEIMVYNMKGIKVMDQSYNNGSISISKLPQGLYIIRVTKGRNELINQHFIKK
jgi:hypothetical protein